MSAALTTYSNRYVRSLPLSTTIALLRIVIIRDLRKSISRSQLVCNIWFVVIPDQAACSLLSTLNLASMMSSLSPLRMGLGNVSFRAP